jgi:serine/threonine protein kinase
VFPWAETDLFRFWERFPNPEKNDCAATWLIEQSRGLAEGLNTIHRYETTTATSLLDESGEHCSQRPLWCDTNVAHADKLFFGRHGDLKPENILWFPDHNSKGIGGFLKITDFGIAQFSTEDRWKPYRGGRPPNSPTYRSPEIDLNGDLSTACDIWALGCVYLQFITWYFGGCTYLNDFGSRRLAVDHGWASMKTDTFFTIEDISRTKKARVKPCVSEVSICTTPLSFLVADLLLQMIDELWSHYHCTSDFKKFITMIRENMLVVHPQDRLIEDKKPGLIVPGQIKLRRKSCGDIVRMLGDIKPRQDQEGDLTT